MVWCNPFFDSGVVVTSRVQRIHPQQVLLHTRGAIREAYVDLRSTLNRVRTRPQSASSDFDNLSRRSGGGSKLLIQIDAAVERSSERSIMKACPKGVQVLGEETLGRFVGWEDEPTCVLLDMLDGTDLYEMGIDLWCSVALVYNWHEQRILAAAIGMASGEIYFATEGDDGVTIEFADNDLYAAEGCSETTQLKLARVAYYGQKPKNFLSLSENNGFQNFLRTALSDPTSTFRIYNFAGNAMMALMGNRARNGHGKVFQEGLDAVFDITGQQLHDCLPGAFIAMKAGAHMFNLRGNELTFTDLGQLMVNPKARIKYVLAATVELGLELVEVLNSPAKAQIQRSVSLKRRTHEESSQLAFAMK